MLTACQSNAPLARLKSNDDGRMVERLIITPRSKGGKADLDNAQTLCGSHNYRKNKLTQLELGDRMFRRLKNNAIASRAEHVEADRIVEFCEEVLKIYEKYGFTSKD